jgi:acetyl esterase/lipase
MLIDRVVFRYFCNRTDKKHLKLLSIPADVERKINIPYGKYGIWNLLDVYYPKGTSQPLPTIIDVHGGGYVYGTKEIYQYYCMSLAQRGFTVVNFNYRLVPKVKFPVPVLETNEVMQWVCAHAAEYRIDLNNIFIAGDSAGAQIASQYSAMVTNPEYAGLFDINIPAFKLKAILLNCGFYTMKLPMYNLLKDYFGKKPQAHGEKVEALKYINQKYPPAFIMSAANDFLLPCARPMYDHLQEKGIESVLKIYGTPEQKEYSHVFHLNPLFPPAAECNDEECEFLKGYVD